MYESEDVAGFQRIRRKRDERSSGGVWGCDGKRRFPSYKSAKFLLKTGWKRSMPNAAPYHCDSCGHWHIGNPSHFHKIA